MLFNQSGRNGHRKTIISHNNQLHYFGRFFYRIGRHNICTYNFPNHQKLLHSIFIRSSESRADHELKCKENVIPLQPTSQWNMRKMYGNLFDQLLHRLSSPKLLFKCWFWLPQSNINAKCTFDSFSSFANRNRNGVALIFYRNKSKIDMILVQLDLMHRAIKKAFFGPKLIFARFAMINWWNPYIQFLMKFLPFYSLK